MSSTKQATTLAILAAALYALMAPVSKLMQTTVPPADQGGGLGRWIARGVSHRGGGCRFGRQLPRCHGAWLLLGGTQRVVLREGTSSTRRGAYQRILSHLALHWCPSRHGNDTRAAGPAVLGGVCPHGARRLALRARCRGRSLPIANPHEGLSHMGNHGEYRT